MPQWSKLILGVLIQPLLYCLGQKEKAEIDINLDKI